VFLRASQTDFLQGLLKNNDRKWAQTINSTFHYIDDVLSLKRSCFDDYLDLIYPNELEVKDTTDTLKYVSYLGLHIEFGNGGGGRLKALRQT
jgi:hypothetical protein